MRTFVIRLHLLREQLGLRGADPLSSRQLVDSIQSQASNSQAPAANHCSTTESTPAWVWPVMRPYMLLTAIGMLAQEALQLSFSSWQTRCPPCPRTQQPWLARGPGLRQSRLTLWPATSGSLPACTGRMLHAHAALLASSTTTSLPLHQIRSETLLCMPALFCVLFACM